MKPVESSRPSNPRQRGPPTDTTSLGTYRCVVDPLGRRAVSEAPKELMRYLRERHEMILASRTGQLPGRWKHAPNQGDGSLFVDPELVEGTVLKGFEFAASVTAGFRRALFVMMVTLEVHPFTQPPISPG